MSEDDGRDWCDTLGCENPPSTDGYCRECIDTSPKLVGEPGTAGETVNPAGDTDSSTDSPRERGEDHRSLVSDPKGSGVEDGPRDRWRACFVDAIDWFHARLDQRVGDHTESGEHPDRPTTAREYFHEKRGWSDGTVDDACLGYAPANESALLDHLMHEGYGREAILGTGLFTESLRPLWQGRYVLPYLDTDGEPVYAISRATGHEGGGAVGYDGHPADGMSGKYAKPAHTKSYAHVEEPIFGLGSVESGEPVLITEGIADAITAHQAGYPCVSPVTTRFKRADRERLAAVLDAHDVPRAYVIGDAEQPGTDLNGEERLTLSQLGEGIDGALDTAAHLADDGVDARVVELPHPSADKVDLDDYLREWSTDGDLSGVLASSKPPEQHPGYDPDERAMRAASSGQDHERERASSGDCSALFSLDIRDVTGRAWGSRGINPLGHHGESETYYVLVEDHAVGYDHKYKIAYNALTHLLVESGERRAESPNGRLDDNEVFAAWRQAKGNHLIPDDDPIPHRALRHVALSHGFCEIDDIENGWKLPTRAYNDACAVVEDEYGLDPGRPPINGEAEADTKPVAILPNSPRARAAANGWDWRSADRSGVENPLTVGDARERTREAISEAYRRSDRALIEARPTMGKSYGAVAAAADTGEPISVFTLRGHREQYQQIREWCEKHGLSYYTLPSFLRDCETANGEFGDERAETVKQWYHRGATGKDIHVHYEDERREPIPCDGPAGARCSYKASWQFDADEYDVLIGNYRHAHVSSATKGRTVVFDEFPGSAFESTLSDATLAGSVTRYLKTTDGIPFEDYTDLLERRDEPEPRARALSYFEDYDPEPDATHAFESGGHALAPVATYTILAAGENDLGNGWERAPLPNNGVGLFDRENARVHLLTPPGLQYTRGIAALDGTPTPRLWELVLGTRLNHRPVLTREESAEYVRDTLGVNIVRTTDYVKSYNSEDHINPENDAALLDAIAEEHGQAPALLTTRTAQRVHENAGLYDTDGEGDLGDGHGRVYALGHYGDLKGSNRFESTRLGVVIGSNHYGDGFVEKWGAFAGERVERVGDGRGIDLEYSGIGEDVHRHMSEHETLQALMRFGRDGGGATVYVHTNTLPEWVEGGALAGEGRVVRTRSEGERQILDALTGDDALGEEWTTAELATHPMVDVGERQVRKHLTRFVDEGYLNRRSEGNGFVWHNDGLHRLGEHGEVELAPVDLDTLDEEESAVLARRSTYTWQFRRNRGSPARSGAGSGSVEASTSSAPAIRADPPPDNTS